jgi:hypothetical protein
MLTEGLQIAQENRPRATRLKAGQHRVRFRVRRPGDEQLAGSRRQVGEVEVLIARILQSDPGEPLDQLAQRPPRSFLALRADDVRRCSEHAIRRVACFAGRLCRRERRVAVEIEFGADCNVDQLAIVLAAGSDRSVDSIFGLNLRSILTEWMTITTGRVRTRHWAWVFPGPPQGG